jgi:hypothetical protein
MDPASPQREMNVQVGLIPNCGEKKETQAALLTLVRFCYRKTCVDGSSISHGLGILPGRSVYKTRKQEGLDETEPSMLIRHS